MQFADAERYFSNDQISTLSAEPAGLRFLKLRSLSRKSHLERLFEESNVEPPVRTAKDMLRFAFDSQDIGSNAIDSTIQAIYEEDRKIRRNEEPKLISELYKMKVFDWGGLHQNSLERTIVNNYVKRTRSFDVLTEQIETELQDSLRGYVLCSWYNHWTSIMIEDVFRDHDLVLPAVGQVKKIDFFIRNVPFDLKVTYFPEGFIKEMRRDQGLSPELTTLRNAARENGVFFDRHLADSKLLEDLWTKLSDHPSPSAQSAVNDLESYRNDLLGITVEEPSQLIRWLYENQGVRRFDASNRMFLVLVDQSNFFDSWKLKRAKPLLSARIHEYLDSVGESPGEDVSFTWEDSSFETLADVIFVVNS